VDNFDRKALAFQCARVFAQLGDSRHNEQGPRAALLHPAWKYETPVSRLVRLKNNHVRIFCSSRDLKMVTFYATVVTISKLSHPSKGKGKGKGRGRRQPARGSFVEG